MDSNVVKHEQHSSAESGRTANVHADNTEQKVQIDLAVSDLPSSLPCVPADHPLSLTMAGRVLAVSTEASSDDTTPVEPTPTNRLSSSQLPSSSSKQPEDSENAGHDANRTPAIDQLCIDSSHIALASSAESSKSVSGSSTPAHHINDLERYHLTQQKLLSQQIHQQLVKPTNLDPVVTASTSKNTATPGLRHPPSASPSTFTSPPESSRSSLEQSSSVRSGTRPHVLETNKLDIQTHTSGRRMVNQYVIEGELGRGVHGKVRLARDVETGERVAVKIVEREARKRLGAGLGLLGRSSRSENKDRLRFSKISTADPVGDLREPVPIAQAHGTTDSAIHHSNDDDAALPSTPSARFAPLPPISRLASPTRIGSSSESEPPEKGAARQKEKDLDKARKALLWTTDQKVRREIAIMKKCCHENVVSLKEVIDDPQSKKVFMVLEFMEGGEIIWKDEQGRPTLTVDESRKIVRDVVCGLEYLHYQGIIHRDIKPANLLYGKDKRVKISDFGVSHFSYAMLIANEHAAAASDPRHSASSSLADDRELAKTAGSPAFFAPELCMASDLSSSASSSASHHIAGLTGLVMSSSKVQSDPDPQSPSTATAAKKHRVTKAIDVWALGVTLYCLLFGHTPFTAESEYALFAVIPSTDYSIPTFMGSDKVRVGARKPRWKSQCQWVDEEADAQPQDPSELSPDVALENLSDDARQLRDLLDRLLEKDPMDRITLEEVKKHPWVTQGLHDTPAWLSQTDPSQHPFVEISHADVEDALTGFSRLKQRVKRWQSKLLDSLGSGRNRSRSIISSSAFFTHHDQKTSSGSSSPFHARGSHFEGSSASSPVDTFGSSSNPSSSVRTSRAPSRAHSFFSRQKSAPSVGKKEGSVAVKALAIADPNQPQPQPQTPQYVTLLSAEQDQDAIASPSISSSPRPDVIQPMTTSLFLPSQRSPDLDITLMKPPVGQRRSSSRSASADTGLRPDVTPEIPQRKSSDTHAASKRSAGEDGVVHSVSPSFAASPQLSSHHRDHSRDGTNTLEEHGLMKKSFDSADRASIASISQASRISGRHRLGDFLRGTWLVHGDNRQRSLSRPSTRQSLEPHLSPDRATADSKRSSPNESAGLSIDTKSAVKDVGARPQAGTPASAPYLIMRGEDGPRMSLDLLSDSVDTPRGKASFAAASQPSSPPGPQTFAFDNLGRRQRPFAAIDTPNSDHDDVDLDLDLSDDDFDDELPASGTMLANSGGGWVLRHEDAYMPESIQRKDSTGSSNDILTPSVEGGYNVFKPPYQHILSGPKHDEAAGSYDPLQNSQAAEGKLLDIDLTMSADAAALRKATVMELQGEVLTSGPSSGSHSRSASGKMPSPEGRQSRTGGETVSSVALPDNAVGGRVTVNAFSHGFSGSNHNRTASSCRGIADDSQFADADEERPKFQAEDIGPELSMGDRAMHESEDDDSDENGISFKAKKSSRMQIGGSSSAK